jgi:hypothetical protein
MEHQPDQQVFAAARRHIEDDENLDEDLLGEGASPCPCHSRRREAAPRKASVLAEVAAVAAQVVAVAVEAGQMIAVLPLRPLLEIVSHPRPRRQGQEMEHLLERGVYVVELVFACVADRHHIQLGIAHQGIGGSSSASYLPTRRGKVSKTSHKRTYFIA